MSRRPFKNVISEPGVELEVLSRGMFFSKASRRCETKEGVKPINKVVGIDDDTAYKIGQWGLEGDLQF